MRKQPDISEEQFRACLRERYGIDILAMQFLPLGQDINAGVYRVADTRNAAYLVKVKRGPLYEPGCYVPRYLRDQGIAEVVAPLFTTSGALWASAGTWTVIVYPFISGVAGWNPGMTDEHWKAVGSVLRRIHDTPLPPAGFSSLRVEAFDPTRYARWVQSCEAQLLGAEHGAALARELRAQWLARQAGIHALMHAMEGLAGALRRQARPNVICHADLHPSNIIRDEAGRVFLIDWDDVMLAPRERDFIFVPGVHTADATGETSREPTPFFQRYGQIAVDGAAFTYFRCERIAQDMIEYAQQALFRDDLGDEARADALRRFTMNLAREDEIAGLCAAAATYTTGG